MEKELLKEIKNDISEIKKDITDIKITMSVNTASLEHHVKRTNLLEELVNHVRKQVEPVLQAYNSLVWLGKIIGWIASVGIISALLKYLDLL